MSDKAAKTLVSLEKGTRTESWSASKWERWGEEEEPASVTEKEQTTREEENQKNSVSKGQIRKFNRVGESFNSVKIVVIH